MIKAQKEYWNRQKSEGKKKVTVLLSIEAQDILLRVKNEYNQSYSTIMEQALTAYDSLNTSKNVIDEKLSKLESFIDEKFEKIELQIKKNESKIKANTKKTTALEKTVIPKPKKRKKQ